MNWQQFLFNACFQVWKGVLTSWITHLLHVGGANLVIWWRISNVHVTLTWKCWRVKLRPHAKIFVYWGSRNLYRYSYELSFTFSRRHTHAQQVWGSLWAVGNRSFGGEMATRLQNSDNNSNNLCFKTVSEHAAMEYSAVYGPWLQFRCCLLNPLYSV